MNRSAFLEWLHPDLLEDRLLHGCALWQAMAALQISADVEAPPSGWPLSEVVWWGCALAVASARVEQTRPAVFRLGSRSLQAQLFCLLHPADSGGGDAPDPLDPQQWRFWLVPFHQLHPDRQSIGVSALRRAHGDGLRGDTLSTALDALLCP